MRSKNILLLLTSVMLAFGCDTIEEPVVYYELCDTTSLNASFNITVEQQPAEVRNVLLEDYTGHTCGNCPAAGKKSDEMVDKYGEQVVPVGVHAGFFAETKDSGKYSTDFTTGAGEEYFEYFNVITNPNGLVNRSPFNGKTVLGIDQWEGAIEQATKTGRLAALGMKNVYNTERRVAMLEVNITFDSATSKLHNLIIMIIEDNIVDWQKDYSDPKRDIEDYVHRHVLRGVVDNKTWGDPVNVNPVSAGKSFTQAYNICIDEAWDDSEVYLAAVLYDTDSKRVVQCEDLKIRK